MGAAWIVREGDERTCAREERSTDSVGSGKHRRGRDVDIPWKGVAATPRLRCGILVETGVRLRYATRIFGEAERCRVALEGYFVSTAVAIRVMEGLANSLDPHAPIGQMALRWIGTSPYAVAGLI